MAAPKSQSHAVVWFVRALLVLMTFVMMSIAVRNLRDPVGAMRPLDIIATAPSAATIIRVGFGGFPLGFAIALLVSALATRRLLAGITLMLIVAVAVTFARVEGLLLDGLTPYNLHLLWPEIIGVTLSSIGVALELRRRRAELARPARGVLGSES